MDGFLSLIRIHEDAQQPSFWSSIIWDAMLKIFPEQGYRTFVNQHVIFVSTQAKVATDCVWYSSGSNEIIYINGLITQLHKHSTKCSQDSDIVDMPISDSELRAFVEPFMTGIVDQKLLEGLSGSYHGFFHDAEHQKTFILIDRLGSRLVFTSEFAGWVAVASDIRLLLSIPQVDRSLNTAALAKFVRTQTFFLHETLYQGISTLPAATCFEIDHQTNRCYSYLYWNWKRLSEFSSFDQAVDATATIFKDATARILGQNEKNGLLLSDGMDSRMLLACLPEQVKDCVNAFTFSPSLNNNHIPQRLSDLAGIAWTPIYQPIESYWDCLSKQVELNNGLYSLYHAHTAFPTLKITSKQINTIIDGWGLDLLFSGSYFPKEQFGFLGRTIYTYRLGRLINYEDTLDYLLRSLDLQTGDFFHSMLTEKLRSEWDEELVESVRKMIITAQSHSDKPYDWIDQVLFGNDVARFRSYPMVTSIRSAGRERNPLYESDIIDLYLQIPYQWRFLGNVFRYSLASINNKIGHITYGNIGTSPLASPWRQAMSMQTRAVVIANRDRLSKLSHYLGWSQDCAKIHGNYYGPEVTARYIISNPTIRRRVDYVLLEKGFLPQSGLVDTEKIRQTIYDIQHGRSQGAMTLILLINLAEWLARFPVDY